MGKVIRLTYCGMDGDGATVREAKLDATRKAEALIRDLAQPKVLLYRRFVVTIYRTTYGWHYMILDRDTVPVPREGAQVHHNSSVGSFGTLEHAERSARAHLAQNAANPRAGDDALDAIENADDRREHIRWCDWQRRYAAFEQEHPELLNDRDVLRRAFDAQELGYR